MSLTTDSLQYYQFLTRFQKNLFQKNQIYGQTSYQSTATSRSPATNLVLFEDYIIKLFFLRRQVDAIELDFFKAFDRVSHSILIQKLETYGFKRTLLNWFKSYLLDRRLQVRYSSGLSEEFEATSSVPQGSHWVPTLLNLFDIYQSCHH